MTFTTLSKKLSKHLTDYFTIFFKENKHKFDENWVEPELGVLATYGLTEPTLMWERWAPDCGDFYNKIEEILDYLEIDYTNYSAFMKAEHIPLGMHVDSEFDPTLGDDVYYLYTGHSSHDDAPGYSIILPIETYGPHCETIIFKQKATGNNELLEKTQGWYNDGIVAKDWKLHNNKYGIDYDDYSHIHMNVYYDNKCILDYLEVEDILQWEKGVALAFDKKQYHTSVNFRKHGILQKNFILVHTSGYPYS